MRISFRLSLIALLGATVVAPLSAAEDEPVRLQEPFAPGYQYHVSTRVDLAGNLILPAEKGQATAKTLAVSGESAIEYDERILGMGAGGMVEKTARIYRRVDFQRRVGDQPQQNTLRPAVRRLVVLRLNHAGVPFSPDGPLTWNEIDLVRTDVFTPALTGLLPDHPVRPGDRWIASQGAIQELTDLERIEEGQVECRLDQVTTLEKRRHARITLSGTVRGVNEDGPNRQQLDGYCYFDLESNHLSYLSLKGVHNLLDKDGKELGKVEGRFVLTRQAYTHQDDLSDGALKGVALEPNASNTALLYDNPDLGVRFVYPRRWHVAGVHGRQVALDEAEGSGLLLTLEPPARLPTGEQFLTETRDYLQQQKAKVLRADPPQRLAGTVGVMEHFALEVEVADKRVVMDYYILRQPVAGATIAARLLPTNLVIVQKEVETIARSVTVSRVPELEPKK